MGESKTELVARLFHDLRPARVDAALELMAEDVVVVVPPSLSAEPDIYEGHAGARRYFDGFEGFMEDVRFSVREVIEEGDVVIVPLELIGRGVTSGIETALSAVVVVWVADGKVTRIEAHPDVEAARTALRGRPGRRPT